MRLAADHVRVTVPATAGNLGPGFDSLGMALGVADTVEVRALATDAVEIEVHGEGAGQVPTDDTHLFVCAFRRALESVDAPLCGVHLVAHNEIPQGRGLGSSAATVVAGITAARAMLAEPDALPPEAVLRLAMEFEGHPDNAAPAILGGATVAWVDDDGPHASPLEVAPEIGAAVLIPGSVLPTAQARAVLPAQVPHADAAFNAGRSALLVHALAGRPELLADATLDRLHQDYRAEAMPAAVAMMRHLREQGLAAVVSGAGPSVLVLGVGLDEAGLGTGELPWADGIGGDNWRSVHTVERVPGATATAL